MNKILLIILLTGLLQACNLQNDKATGINENHAEHKTNSTGLALNNGSKWHADSVTLLNVALLKDIVSDSNKNTSENYIQTAKQLQNGLNKMIIECKMKGADHSALHQWLEPLLEETKELNNAATPKNAEVILNGIEKQINLFQQYFE